ncbi:DNA repair protein RecN [Methylophaga sp. 42_25_T18]|nr:DNA repair protein RecN [Methylophaga sp. 42_25_T18]OUR89025.1 DNA repair protein RecN [Methylophaga sp. 42_8_T64]
MLTQLSVRHLAVVDDLELTFSNAMTSLTGETGAGKSLLVDALSLVLGDRADTNMIRHGCDRAEISASFDTVKNQPLQQWLKSQELDDDAQCHLRRTISKDGRSRAYINGRTVPLSQLRAVSERTIDIHGQHAHQSLIRAETQRLLIDTIAGTGRQLTAQAIAYKEWQSLQQQLLSLQQQTQEQSARLELLQYQVSELEILELTDDGVQSLLTEQQQLAHASQLISIVELGLQRLFDQEQNDAYSLISSVLTELEKSQEVEPQFTNIVETLNSIIIQLDECGGDLRHYLDSTHVNPDRLTEVETQLSTLHDIARKHHVEIESLPAHYQQLSDELAGLTGLDNRLEQLQQQLNEQEKSCRDLCDEIRQKRHSAAGPLAEQITESIQQLAIPGGRIEIVITPLPNNHFNETGADNIQLLVSTNPGQAAGELGKVASGGELARISLAIQVVTAGSRSVPTLVFDEVDVGIGGGIAEIVGRHLRKLASTQQVICITHLPQVAAQAQQQLQVRKQHSTDSTHIEIFQLNEIERIEEIARMLGGVTLTEKTRLHAEEMLSDVSN